jgi:hypothetical protein
MKVARGEEAIIGVDVTDKAVIREGKSKVILTDIQVGEEGDKPWQMRQDPYWRWQIRRRSDSADSH